MNGFIVAELSCHSLKIGGFNRIVEFPAKASGKFFNNPDRSVVCDLLHMGLGKGGQVVHDFKIHLNELAYAGSLDLDGHLTDPRKTRPVDPPPPPPPPPGQWKPMQWGYGR